MSGKVLTHHMRHLNYGLIPDFEGFAHKEMFLSKLGGYLNPTEMGKEGSAKQV